MTDNLAVPCAGTSLGGCPAPAGSPCVYTSGPNAGKPRAARYGSHAVRGWGLLQWTAGVASRDAEVKGLTDSVTLTGVQYKAAQGTIANLRAQIVELQDQLTPPVVTPPAPVDVRPLIAAAKGGAIALPAGVFEGADFNSPTNSPVYAIFAYQVPSFTGAGKTQTILRVKPGSNTRTAPAQNAGASVVNPYYVLRVDGAKTPDVGGFTLLGSNEVLHNGLILYNDTIGAPSVKRLHDVLIKGVPGNAAVNPGETFSLNVFRQTGTLVEDSEVDGTDANGKVVAASGIGVNNSTGITHRRVHVSHTGYGSGWANYYSSNLTFEDCGSEDTAYYSLNFENCSGTNRITRQTVKTSAVRTASTSEAGHHMAIATNNTSATYLIEDPSFTGPKFRVRSTGYLGKAKTQNDADITLTVGGVARPDLLDIAVA